jgi:hypothetical protein
MDSRIVTKLVKKVYVKKPNKNVYPTEFDITQLVIDRKYVTWRAEHAVLRLGELYCVEKTEN